MAVTPDVAPRLRSISTTCGRGGVRDPDGGVGVGAVATTSKAPLGEVARDALAPDRVVVDDHHRDLRS